MMKKNKGFNIIELMIVVAIVGVVAGMSMPAFMRIIERNRLKSALEALQGELQSARVLAIKQSTNITLSVTASSTTAGNWCYGITAKTANTCNCNTANSCEIRTIPGSGFSTVITPATTTNVTFEFRRGTITLPANTTQIEIPFYTSSYKSSVIVDAGGRVRICAPSDLEGKTALPGLKC